MRKIFIILSILLFSQSLLADLITDDIKQKALKKYGPGAKKRFTVIHKKLLNDLKDASELEKLDAVNSWYNYIQYASDKKLYHVNDYWATLYEFVGKGKGDCEDYTIAKYYTLKELGIDPNKMKFTYVIYKSRSGKKISHMVLSYFRKPKPKLKRDILILDNTNHKVLPASKRKNIVKMIKMINGDTGAQSRKWKELDQNMKRMKL